MVDELHKLICNRTVKLHTIAISGLERDQHGDMVGVI
jgi:hypothetical protein